MATTVKFCHPGQEWASDQSNGVAGWVRVTEAHTRRYLQVTGQYVRSPGGPVEAGRIGLWGEYEAPTEFRRIAQHPPGGLPTFAHTPVPLAQVKRPAGALNTDPFVFGSHWLFSNCRQRSQPRLRRLQRGDVIIFGSLVHRSFVVDTVFVVAESVPYRGGVARATVGAQVPDLAYRLVLDLVRSGDYTLYIGATYDKPVNGLFSFVPALPVAEEPEGFARPPAPPSLQSQQAMGVKYLDNPAGYWTAVALVVLGQGLCLGISATLPER